MNLKSGIPSDIFSPDFVPLKIVPLSNHCDLKFLKRKRSSRKNTKKQENYNKKPAN